MKTAPLLVRIGAIVLLLGLRPVLALDPSLDISQYAHTAFTAQNGFSVGAIFAMAQTPDGYLWLGTESGLYRFDGVRAVAWQAPAGQKLPAQPYSLLASRDGTLWIGTFAGLASWDGTKLTAYPETGGKLVTSLLEDRDGTVWAGIAGQSNPPTGQLCAIRGGRVQCDLNGGAFGDFVWSLSQDNSGAIWAAAETGLWRWKPGAPKLYATPGARLNDIVATPDGQVTIAVTRQRLEQLVYGKLVPFPVRSSTNPKALLTGAEIDANKLLRDRDGGLWIGTHQHGLIYIHNGKTDVMTSADGLSGDISCSLFEDREGNIWFGSSRGLDRFRELPVITVSTKQGLSSPFASSLIAAADGGIWIGSVKGLTHWNSEQTTIFRTGRGVPNDDVQSLFEDHQGRIWSAFTGHGLFYFKDGRFVDTGAAIPSTEVYSITGDNEDNLWLSGNKGLSHVRDGRLIETVPWAKLGRDQQAKVIIFDPARGGLWLVFWRHGGVLFYKDGKVNASYSPENGLAQGEVASIRLDDKGVVWAATQKGGISRIKDGHIATLSTQNGLPCDVIHWSIEDNDHANWLYTGCGLVRITRSELDAWIADPQRKIKTTTWDSIDGVRATGISPAYFNPPVAKADDGRIWFLTGDAVAIVDPHHLASNTVAPPVHIQQIVADRNTVWQSSAGQDLQNLRLPPRIRDLAIDYTALSLTAPEKVHFKYKLEGQDSDWKEVVNNRVAAYTNLAPRKYIFRVIASNNSGVWNEEGAALDFVIPPAWYQTSWFLAACVAAFLVLLWALYQYRLHQLGQQFNVRLEERVSERTRIARDLHDTLLQSFHGVLLFLQSGINLLPDRPVEAKKNLEGAAEQAERAIIEGREAVQGLRASTVERNDLALAIKTLGADLGVSDSNPQRPEFAVQVEGIPRNLHPILRDEVYRITGEAMHNAFRHSDAKQIEVEIHYDERRVRVRVRDDGKGIDPKLLSDDGREGHFGLRGMRERAKLIGGKLTVWSELDAGTEVELSIPASRAYTVADGQRSWLAEKFAKLSANNTKPKS